MTRAPGAWVVYTREGCTLCGEFLLGLADLLGTARAAGVQVVDIEGDPSLLRKYKDRIPVLTIDGDFVCNYRLDHERLRPYLTDAGALKSS